MGKIKRVRGLEKLRSWLLDEQVAPELLPDQPPEETVNSGRPDDPSQQQHEEPSNREHNADLNEGVAAPKRKTRAEIDALSDSVTNSTAGITTLFVLHSSEIGT